MIFYQKLIVYVISEFIVFFNIIFYIVYNKIYYYEFLPDSIIFTLLLFHIQGLYLRILLHIATINISFDRKLLLLLTFRTAAY